jgi:hypothetical protein
VGRVSMPMQSDRLQQGLQALRDGFLERVTARCLAIEAILVAAADADQELVAEDDRVVPLKGLEPPTPSLRMTCSTS